jgi:hypothetical protein
MSTRCQVLVKSFNEKYNHEKIGTCPKYGKKFFKVRTNGRWRQEAIIGICEKHLLTHGDPTKWKDKYSEGHIRWLGGQVQSFEEVEVSNLRQYQKTQVTDGVKLRLKHWMGQRNVAKLTREEWQQVFQEALDEFCVENVMGA